MMQPHRAYESLDSHVLGHDGEYGSVSAGRAVFRGGVQDHLGRFPRGRVRRRSQENGGGRSRYRKFSPFLTREINAHATLTGVTSPCAAQEAAQSDIGSKTGGFPPIGSRGCDRRYAVGLTALVGQNIHEVSGNGELSASPATIWGAPGRSSPRERGTFSPAAICGEHRTSRQYP